MTKKVIIFIFMIVCAATVVMLWRTIIKINQRQLSNEMLETVPNLDIKDTNGADINLQLWSEGKSLVIFYFDSMCEHCNKEINDLKANFPKLNGTKILMLSSEDADVVNNFNSESKLTDMIPNLMFATISTKNARDNMGLDITPTIYVYNHKGVLVKKFIGQTDIKIVAASITQ